MEFCRVERDGHLLIVTLDRPQVRNALHRPASDELDQVWTLYETDPELRVAILTGAGDKAFSAGYDMKDPFGRAGEPSGGGFLANRHPRGFGALTHRFGITSTMACEDHEWNRRCTPASSAISCETCFHPSGSNDPA